jgi:hypothetical protein
MLPMLDGGRSDHDRIIETLALSSTFVAHFSTTTAGGGFSDANVPLLNPLTSHVKYPQRMDVHLQ